MLTASPRFLVLCVLPRQSKGGRWLCLAYFQLVSAKLVTPPPGACYPAGQDKLMARTWQLYRGRLSSTHLIAQLSLLVPHP